MAQSERWNNRLKALALGIGLALTMLTVRHWYGTFMDGHPPCNDCRADFPGFYAAAKLIWEKPSALYDNAPQLAIQKAIDNRIGDSILPFAYPPVTALLLMPLGWLSFRMAFVAITLVNMALLWFTLRLLIRKLGLQKQQSTWLLLSTFCNFGVHSVLLQGQTSLVVLFCLTAFMFSAMSGKQFHAGFWAGLNFLKPQLLPVPFIALTFQRLWHALSIAAVVVAGLCLLSVVLVGTEGISQYLQLLRFYSTTESGFGSYPEKMHNLRALVQYFAPFSLAPYLWVAMVVPIALLTMWLNASKVDGDDKTAFLWIGNFLTMMLITPHLYSHDLSFLLVPSALTLKLSGATVPLFVPPLLICLSVLPILPLVVANPVPPPLPIIFLLAYLGCVWMVRKSITKRSSLVAEF